VALSTKALLEDCRPMTGETAAVVHNPTTLATLLQNNNNSNKNNNKNNNKNSNKNNNKNASIRPHRLRRSLLAGS